MNTTRDLPACTADSDPIVGGTLLADLTINLTSLAQRACLAASIPADAPDEAGVHAARETTLAIWTELTGLELPDALLVARAITADPSMTTAAVVPF